MLTTLTETLLIVIAVIFLFLGSVRAVIIPVVAIPISLVGAVFLMLVAGFTVNLLTLLAIVLSVGLVVDDAIVMVENIERHLHAGKRPFRAAIDAARELVGPIIAMTITLAAVYAPIGIQGGLTGALFREFAFTLAGAVIVSGVVALTLSPMMGSRLLRAGDTERGFAGWINRRFDSLRNGYTRVLGRSLAYRPVVLTLWAIVALLIVPFYMFSQRELAPAGGPGRRVLDHPGRAERDDRADEALRAADQRRLQVVSRGRWHFRADVSERRVRRHGDQAVERADQDGAAAADGGDGTAVADSRRARVSHHAAGAAGRRRLSRWTRDRLAGRAAAARRDRRTARAEGVRQRHVHLRRRRSEVRPAAGRGRLRSRQAAVAGRGFEPGGARPVDPARRRLRQPLQHPGAQLQGDSADRARRTPDAGPTVADLHHRVGRQARAAVDVREPEDHRAAARAEEVPAAQCRSRAGRHSAARAARHRARVPRERGAGDSARRVHDRLRRASRASSGQRGAASSARSCCRQS